MVSMFKFIKKVDYIKHKFLSGDLISQKDQYLLIILK